MTDTQLTQTTKVAGLYFDIFMVELFHEKSESKSQLKVEFSILIKNNIRK